MTGRATLYWRYALRSLRRGGQRSLLAVFCIAVGVMAIVALRLAGDMITLSVTSNVRGVLGGDLSLQANSVPLTAADLGRVDELQRRDLIDSYLAIGSGDGTARRPGGHITRLIVYVLDDPTRYPLVGTGDIRRPSDRRLGDLVTRPGTVVLSDFIASQLDVDVGATIHLNLTRGGGADVTVAGIASNRPTAGGATAGFISRATYQEISTQPERYGLVDMLEADPARAASAAQVLRAEFPAASVQTVADAIDENVTISTDINRFLVIVGLLALLMGGVGIVNTMHVSLSRRRVEIAMLKTTGYRRRDLYALFALEAGILGLAGGVLGTLAGIGVSALVRFLVQRVFLIDIVFHVAPLIVISGVAVGLATALIFGLLPIVRASAVRPAAVLRDQGQTATVGSAFQSAVLYLLLVLLFTGLSLSLIGSLGWTLVTVAATIVVIAALSGLFALVVMVVARLPVPERPNLRFFALVTLAAVPAFAAAYYAHAVGAALLILAVTGYVVAFLPRRLKTALLLALRAIGRARGRTSATMVALFVGVFTIGLIVVLGQDISTKINESLNTLSGFNVFAIASGGDGATVRQVTANLPGLQERSITEDVPVVPVRIGDRTLADVAASDPERRRTGERQFRVGALAGIQGYDLSRGQLPDAFILFGEPLTAADAGTTNVLVRADLRNRPYNLRLGNTITVTQASTQRLVTLRISGFYVPLSTGPRGLRFAVFLQPILADRSVVDAIAGGDLQTVVSMKLDPSQKDTALHRLETAAPGVEIIDLADYAALITQFLSNLVILLVVIASLALFAAIVIIGNTVALAMLERRREIGVLKAVGHSSRSVLAQVLVENGVVASIGAVAGMAAVTLAAYLLGRFLLQTDLAVGTPIVVAVVAGIVALVTTTATLVAWGPTRVRPLEVLRYE